jgi:hypothetical protein
MYNISAFAMQIKLKKKADDPRIFFAGEWPVLDEWSIL